MKILIVLATCLGFACVPATYRAGVRRMAETHLKFCRQGLNDVQAESCYIETRAYCAARGLERTCGEGY